VFMVLVGAVLVKRIEVCGGLYRIRARAGS